MLLLLLFVLLLLTITAAVVPGLLVVGFTSASKEAGDLS